MKKQFYMQQDMCTWKNPGQVSKCHVQGGPKKLAAHYYFYITLSADNQLRNFWHIYTIVNLQAR